MAIYYLREDGSAANLAAAVGPESDASACMDITLHNASTFAASDIIIVSGLSVNDYTSTLVNQRTGLTYRASNSPVIDATSLAFGIQSITKDDAVFEDIEITGGTNRAIDFANADNAKFDGMIIDTPSGLYGAFLLYNVAAAISDGFEFLNSTFTLGASSNKEGIRFRLNDASVINVKVNGNNFTGGKYSIRFFGEEATIGVNDRSPEFVEISGNTFTDSLYDPIFYTAGIKWDGTEAGRSVASNNVITGVGTVSDPNINAIGLQWCRGLIVEDNTIDTVETSVPDGHAIIVDFAWKNDAYICSDVIVRRNILSNCTAGTGTSAGIRIYKGKDTLVNNNCIFDCEVGFSNGNVLSTGNVGYNNTCVNNNFSGFRGDSPGVGDPGAVPLMNNIFVGGQYSVYVNNNVSEPTLTTNCYYGATVQDRWNASTSSTIAAEAGAVEADPQFVDPLNDNYNLKSTSPCVGVGTKWWGNGPRPLSLSGEPLPDTKIDLGAYQSTWDANHPINMF